MKLNYVDLTKTVKKIIWIVNDLNTVLNMFWTMWTGSYPELRNTFSQANTAYGKGKASTKYIFLAAFVQK